MRGVHAVGGAHHHLRRGSRRVSRGWVAAGRGAGRGRPLTSRCRHARSDLRQWPPLACTVQRCAPRLRFSRRHRSAHAMERSWRRLRSRQAGIGAGDGEDGARCRPAPAATSRACPGGDDLIKCCAMRSFCSSLTSSLSDIAITQAEQVVPAAATCGRAARGLRAAMRTASMLNRIAASSNPRGDQVRCRQAVWTRPPRPPWVSGCTCAFETESRLILPRGFAVKPATGARNAARPPLAVSDPVRVRPLPGLSPL